MPPRLVITLATLAGLCAAAEAQEAMLERAVGGAIDQFEQALPALPAQLFGVDVAAYRDALSLHRFQSRHWGGRITVALQTAADPSNACDRFAAYTRLPPADGQVQLVLCPKFFSPGADALRVLTILHEMVHVVAGSDECRAMAFAARIEQVATGTHTPVDAYWQANGCADGEFSLP